MIANWAEVAWAGLYRLRRRLDRDPLDEDLQKLVSGAQEALHGVPPPEHRPGGDGLPDLPHR